MKKLLLFLFISFNSFSQQYLGADIGYKFVGNTTNPYRYKIVIDIYTRCTGTICDEDCEIPVYIGGGMIDSTLAPCVNGPSIICPSTADGIMIGGCSGNIKHSIYETTHNFAGPGSYFISTNLRNRQSGICNVPDSDNQSLFLQTELIISPFLGNNTSPVYNEVPVICKNVGIISYYNPLATDSDGDSLHYEIALPMADGSPLLTWTYPPPTGSFTIDNNTGNVTWNAPPIYCQYVFDIKITEWRSLAGSYFYIGSSMQEIFINEGAFANISENNTSTSVSVFPNPSNGLINFTIENASEDQEYQLIIRNSLGQTVKTMAINGKSSILNEDELSSGIYFYSLATKNQVLNQGKFVVLGEKMK